MLTNESCTLYIKSGNGFDRWYIPRCQWQESKAANVLKSGMTNADGLTVYIFEKDISGELKTLLSARRHAAEDMIVRGECNFTFDNTTPQSASQSLKAFNAAYDAHTVMTLDKLIYGGESLRHFRISANRKNAVR